MPKYSFECQFCGPLRFSRTLKMGEWPTHACPQCKEASPRLFDSFGFAFQAGTGAAQASTGVHANDYPTADVAVGRSATERWEMYRERDKVKKKVRELGHTGALQRLDGPGFVEYDAMSSEGKQVREKVVDYAVKMEHQPIVKRDR